MTLKWEYTNKSLSSAKGYANKLLDFKGVINYIVLDCDIL